MNINLLEVPRIDYNHISYIGEDAADLVVYAIPLMVFFTIIELWYSWYSNRKNYNFKETLGSVFVGLGNVAVNLIFKIGLIYGVVFIYNSVSWRIASNWWTIIPCLFLFDLCSYWSHRISHFNRFFWATHVVHHTAEHYNLCVSFRMSWVQHFKIIFFLPIALMGFHPLIFFMVNQISVLFQFWQHTEYIKKLNPILEWLIVTPSNHRVHHGTDAKYINKNFAAIFIFWDRLFKTYQREEEKPTYGITTKIDKTLNPVYLNFHEFEAIFSDVRNAKGIKRKLYCLFVGPAGIEK
jgi:sterol desaturase/sphingolipid hydroxylase (fatty acid hydroxylase superfamily)